MALEFKSASAVESVRFTAQVAVPNVVQGLFKRRELPVRIAARLGVDGAAYRLMEGLVEKYGADPFYVAVAGEKTLIVHHPEDIEVVLSGSPTRFGSDPDAKRKGMRAFQPDALTLSRADLWAQRRAFADAVLSSQEVNESLLAKVADEAASLMEQESVDFATLNRAFQRLARRVVLGERAADDTDLTGMLEDLMAAGNKLPDQPAAGYVAFIARLQEHLDAAEPGSLSSLMPPVDGGSAGQVVHWLFAMGDTLPANLMRTLALLATHPDEVQADQEHLAACLQEAMRLWPTTPMFGRVALEDVRFPNGKLLRSGTPVLIVNSFNHRQRSRVEHADRFAPFAWTEGDAASSWAFNFFSHGPQGCPGAGMSILIGTALLRQLVDAGKPVLQGASLSPENPLPYSLDVYGISVSWE